MDGVRQNWEATNLTIRALEKAKSQAKSKLKEEVGTLNKELIRLQNAAADAEAKDSAQDNELTTAESAGHPPEDARTTVGPDCRAEGLTDSRVRTNRQGLDGAHRSGGGDTLH